MHSGSIGSQVLKLSWYDYHHKQHHCEEDWPHHLQSLLDNCARVFANALVIFILSFACLPSVPMEFVHEFQHNLQSVKAKWLKP